MAVEFECACCDEIIQGMPSFSWDFPLSYLNVPEDKRGTDVFLTDNLCAIQDRWFFIRACIEIPVIGYNSPIIWGVWIDVSREDYTQYKKLLDNKELAHTAPYLGWLNSSISTYPDTINLRTKIHLRAGSLRPYVELEPTNHPLAIEQRDGITLDRVAKIYAQIMHGKEII